MKTHREVFACKITLNDWSKIWLDLGLQVDSESGTVMRCACLDIESMAWRKVKIYEYGGNRPSIKEAKGEYVCTQYASK